MADVALLEKLRNEIRSIETHAGGHRTSDENAVSVHAERDSGYSEFEEYGYEAREVTPYRSEKKRADAFSKIVALVNVSDRSELAIRQRLEQEGYPENEREEAIERAKSYGFIDDMRFAEVLIRSRVSQGKGSAGIERELKSHGIDIDQVPGWPYDFAVDHETEIDRALLLLERKPPRSKNAREGAFRKLVGKGYSSSVASSAARMWSERLRD